MAHASIDYHMDFISLLSLSNIGVVEPEILIAKKQHQSVVEPQANFGCNGITHPQPSSHGTLHLVNGMNGLERGPKRGRENGGELEALEQDQLYEDFTKVNKAAGII